MSRAEVEPEQLILWAIALMIAAVVVYGMFAGFNALLPPGL